MCQNAILLKRTGQLPQKMRSGSAKRDNSHSALPLQPVICGGSAPLLSRNITTPQKRPLLTTSLRAAGHALFHRASTSRLGAFTNEFGLLATGFLLLIASFLITFLVLLIQ